MTGDPYAMSQEIVELQIRVSELMVAVERITEQRDNAVDAAESLHKELEDTKFRLSITSAYVDRLRIHLQQGIEL